MQIPRILLKLPDFRGLQKKHWLYIAGTAAGLLLIAAGITLAVILIGPGTPKILAQAQPEPQEVSKFIQSERFGKLPEEQKVAFVEKILDNEYYDDKYDTMFSGMNKEDGKKLGEQIRPVFMKVINKKLDDYFRMNKQDKTAFLDKFLDRMERGRKRMEDKMKSQGKDMQQMRQAMRDRQKNGDAPKTPEAGFKTGMESISPQRRTQYMQFGLDMMSRMKERGITFGQMH